MFRKIKRKKDKRKAKLRKKLTTQLYWLQKTAENMKLQAKNPKTINILVRGQRKKC